jgi:Glyoxalase-like domain
MPYPRAVLTGIDHVILAVNDLDRATHELAAALGLAATGGGRHPAWGTANRLVWLGDSYLELVGVEDPGVAASGWFGRAVLEAQRVARARAEPTDVDERGGPAAAQATGPGGHDWLPVGCALVSDDLAGDAAARGWGEPGSPAVMPGVRTRPDGREVRWWTAWPPGATSYRPLVFAIEHDRAAAEWTDGERADRAATAHPLGSPVRLSRLELAVTVLPAVQDRLLRGFDLRFRPSLAGGGARDAGVGGQTLRLRRLARGAPEATISMRAAGPAAPREAWLGGVRFLIEP